MLTIMISDPVWQAIATRGKFGETEDDVLRRVFNLPQIDKAARESSLAPTTHIPDQSVRAKSPEPRRSFATNRMSSYISGNELRVSFASGSSNSWPLPPKNDKNAIRVIRDKAVSFAEKNGATVGQVNAVKKSLTEAGYHLLR